MMNGEILGGKLLPECDLALWRLVEEITWRFACLEKLPLTGVEPLRTHGESKLAGWCDTRTGRIAIALRFSKRGRWRKKTLSVNFIADTIAHELAHLRHRKESKKHRKYTQIILDNMFEEGVFTELRKQRYIYGKTTK